MEEQLKIDFEKLLEKSNFSKKNIEIKRKNFNNFIEKGFPNKREENWKFSDLNQIISKNIKNLSFYNDLSNLLGFVSLLKNFNFFIFDKII